MSPELFYLTRALMLGASTIIFFLTFILSTDERQVKPSGLAAAIGNNKKPSGNTKFQKDVPLDTHLSSLQKILNSKSGQKDNG